MEVTIRCASTAMATNVLFGAELKRSERVGRPPLCEHLHYLTVY